MEEDGGDGSGEGGGGEGGNGEGRKEGGLNFEER